MFHVVTIGRSYKNSVQVEIHKEVVDGMFAECEAREQDNLKVMSELFECTVDDLKICR